MGRDRGRGKHGGRGGGGRGGKMYIANVEELQLREQRFGGKDEDDDEESEEEESEEEKEAVVPVSKSAVKDAAPGSIFTAAEAHATASEGSSDSTANTSSEGAAKPALSDREEKMNAMRARLEQLRLQREAAAGAATDGTPADNGKKAEKKAKAAEGTAAAPKKTVTIQAPAAAPAGGDDEAEGGGAEAGASGEMAGLTRKQREALEAERRKEAYQKRHNAGETEEAKRQLAQLAIVRKRREEAEKARLAAQAAAPAVATNISAADDDDDDEDESDDEEESEEEEAAAKGGKAKSGGGGDKKGPSAKSIAALPKLKSMDIKKMSGDQLKDHLKERGCDIQGQKKDLIKRLCDFEAARA